MSASKPTGSVFNERPLQDRSASAAAAGAKTAGQAETATSNEPNAWIGVIDLGSSAIKCMAGPANEPDDLHLVTQLPTPTLQADLQSEFIPEKLDACIEQALEGLATFVAGDGASKASHGKHITAIALTGQVGGVLLLDDHKRLLSPCLTWADRRAADEAQTFWETFGDRFKALLGHDLPAQTCWSAPKIRRLMKLAGESIYKDGQSKRVAGVMQLPDYAFFRLTGQLKSSPTLGISLVDQTKGQYQQAILQWAGLVEAQLPALDGAVASGPLAGSLAERWQSITQQNLVPDVVLAGADMYCGLYGSMAAQGQAIIQAGTTEIAGVLVAKDHQPPDAKVLLRLTYPDSADGSSVASSADAPAHATVTADGLDVIYGSTSNGGMSLSWLQREHGVDTSDPALWATASQLIPDPNGIIFVPHVNGARSPLWCDQAAGGFVGAPACCDPPHLLLAVLQGCAMSKRSVLQAAGVMKHDSGQPDSASQVIVAGGGARQALANQVRADVLGRPVVVRHVSDVTAAGAIALALNHRANHGTRWLHQLHGRAGSSHFQPNAAYRATYDTLYMRYRLAEQSMLPESARASAQPC